MITILMSTYNGAQYLEEQLDSIFKQKMVDFKLLVRDDGSTDETVNILKKYQEKYANLTYYCGNNLGCAKSFYQLVLDAPESEYYAFADQDDVWDDIKLYSAYIKIKDHNNLPALYCSATRLVNQDLEPIYSSTNKSRVNTTLGVALTQTVAPGCSFVFNNPLMNHFKQFGANNIDIHDWSLYRIAVALNSYIVYDNCAYFSYRQHGNNLIGAQYNPINHWKGRFNRFFSRKNRNIKSIMARRILDVYGNQICNENMHLLEIVANNKYSLINKIRLIREKKIFMVKSLDNLLFKFLVLFGRV